MCEAQGLVAVMARSPLGLASLPRHANGHAPAQHSASSGRPGSGLPPRQGCQQESQQQPPGVQPHAGVSMLAVLLVEGPLGA